MKPKFDVTKPYTTSRDTIPAGTTDAPSDTVIDQPTIKKAKEVVSELATAKCAKVYSNLNFPNRTWAFTKCSKAYCRVEIPKCCHTNKQAPPNLSPLNVDRILIPPMASLSCILVRYYSAQRANKPEVFWRPKARIPDSNEIITKLKNPATRKEALKETKYLFLDYEKMEPVKKKNFHHDLRKGHSPPHLGMLSAMSKL